MRVPVSVLFFYVLVSHFWCYVFSVIYGFLSILFYVKSVLVELHCYHIKSCYTNIRCLVFMLSKFAIDVDVLTCVI